MTMFRARRTGAGRLLIAAFACGLATAALAGGPLYTYDFENRIPYAWRMSSWPNGKVPIYTDLGFLGALAPVQINGLVADAASQWSNVPTSSFRAAVAGDFSAIGLGDVSNSNITSIIGTNNGGGIHVVYDDDGSILSDFFGVPPTAVLGISNIELVAVNSSEILEAWTVLSGPGVSDTDIGGVGYAGVVTHEMGHAINLGHTQGANGAAQNLNILDPPQPADCDAPWTGAPDVTQVETMYPFQIPETGNTGEFIGSVDRIDDRAALSDIYPGPGWPANKATIRGQILDSSGNQVTGINVIARNVSDPFNDCTSYITGQVSKGEAGPDGSFVMNGLTPGATYVLYVDQILNGAYSVPVAVVMPGPEEYFSGASESGNSNSDDRCAWSPVAVTAGSPVEADIMFNHFPGAPTFLTAPDTSVQSVPYDITADGSVVVGGAGLGSAPPVFRWDLNTNTFDIIGGGIAPGSCGISDDGLKIAANVVDTDGINKAAIYSNGAWTVLPPVTGSVGCDHGDGPVKTFAYDISGDGSTVVGLSYGSQGCGESTIRGFKWTAAGGTVALPKLDAPSRLNRANAVNYDGTVIVGRDDANNGQLRGVQWRNGVYSLIKRNNLSVGEALDVSSDGHYIVGVSNSAATDRKAWVWSQPAGVQVLSPLPGQDTGLSGTLNDDASVISGQALDFDAGTLTPTIWTQGLGTMDLNQFLSAQGVVTAGLGMHLGITMSADGRTIAGYAESRIGYVGWVLKTPTSLVCHASPESPNGAETMAVAFPQGLNEHLFHGDTLGPCPCFDADGDGYSTCGGDCNDSNPAVHPGVSDASCNGVDDDCDGTVDVVAPSTHPALTVAQAAGETHLSWGAVSTAAAYDVFAGDLSELRAHTGDYSTLSLAACLSNDLAATSLSAGSGTPAPGGGNWFIVRAINCAGAGTYDEGGAGQSGSRDQEIQASSAPCP